MTGIPPVAEDHPDDVFPGKQEIRDIVTLVVNADVIVGPSGCENILANPLAVDLTLE
jgi:hypothetical protein